MILWLTKREQEVIEGLRVLREMKPDGTLPTQLFELRKEIETLKIERDRIKETHAREERELRHMIGLEKKRQEVEIEQAKRSTSLEVREQNLAADKQRFTDEMKFQNDRFSKEVEYLKGLMGEILNRLPTVTVDRTVRR